MFAFSQYGRKFVLSFVCVSCVECYLNSVWFFPLLLEGQFPNFAMSREVKYTNQCILCCGEYELFSSVY